MDRRRRGMRALFSLLIRRPWLLLTRWCVLLRLCFRRRLLVRLMRLWRVSRLRRLIARFIWMLYLGRMDLPLRRTLLPVGCR